VLAIFFVPLFFVVILTVFRVKPGKPGQDDATPRPGVEAVR
jgi:hypothetical protein